MNLWSDCLSEACIVHFFGSLLLAPLQARTQSTLALAAHALCAAPALTLQMLVTRSATSARRVRWSPAAGHGMPCSGRLAHSLHRPRRSLQHPRLSCPCSQRATHHVVGTPPLLAAGTFQSVSGALSCIECPVGTYSVMTGSASLKDCLPAPPGNYAEGIGNDGFVPCPAGTFQNLPGQGACKVGGVPRALLFDGRQRAALVHQMASILHPGHALLPAGASGSLSPSHSIRPALPPCSPARPALPAPEPA